MMNVKERIKDYIDRTERVFDVLAGGVLGGIATEYLLRGNANIVMKVFWAIVALLVIFALIKKFWLKK